MRSADGWREAARGAAVTKLARSLGVYDAVKRVENLARLRQRLKFYRAFIRSGALCFDVGANLGNRSDVFLRLGARVVAIEPVEECCQVLRRRFGRHPRFALVPAALAEAPGLRTLYVAELTAISSMSQDFIEATEQSRRFGRTIGRSEETIRVTTLDRLIEIFGRPDFLKIDVEGYEAAVLAGLGDPVPVVSFEFAYETRQEVGRCLKELERLGVSYQYNFSLSESMKWALPHWCSRAEIEEEIARLSPLSWGDVYAGCELSLCA